jgi:hypothetical protein
MAPMRLGAAACTRCAILAKASGQEPGRRRAVDAHEGPVEALQAQAVDDVAGLVGDPLLVDRLVHARQDPHDLAAAGIDPDVGADRVHDVDGIGLGRAPRAGN